MAQRQEIECDANGCNKSIDTSSGSEEHGWQFRTIANGDTIWVCDNPGHKNSLDAKHDPAWTARKIVGTQTAKRGAPISGGD